MSDHGAQLRRSFTAVIKVTQMLYTMIQNIKLQTKRSSAVVNLFQQCSFQRDVNSIRYHVQISQRYTIQHLIKHTTNHSTNYQLMHLLTQVEKLSMVGVTTVIITVIIVVGSILNVCGKDRCSESELTTDLLSNQRLNQSIAYHHS